MADLAVANAAEAKQVGFGAAQELWKSSPDLNKVMEIDAPHHLKYAIAFGLVAMPCPVVTLSEQPEGGVMQVCLPFLNLKELLPQSTELVAKMRDSLGILVFGLAHLLETDMVTE